MDTKHYKATKDYKQRNRIQRRTVLTMPFRAGVLVVVLLVAVAAVCAMAPGVGWLL